MAIMPAASLPTDKDAVPADFKPVTYESAGGSLDTVAASTPNPVNPDPPWLPPFHMGIGLPGVNMTDARDIISPTNPFAWSKKPPEGTAPTYIDPKFAAAPASTTAAGGALPAPLTTGTAK